MTDRDTDITDRISRGDREAFRELFDRYYKPLCVYAVKYVESFDDAEDIVQDVLASFWIRYSQESFLGSPRSYLFASVRNNGIRLAKKQKKDIPDREGHFPQVEEAFELVDNIEAETVRLAAAVASLPEQCRKVFTAVILEDMKYSQAAEALGLSINTVKTQLSRSLRKLRGSLDVIVMIMLR